MCSSDLDNSSNVAATLANMNAATRELPALVIDSQQLVRDARALSAQAMQLAAEATALASESKAAVGAVRGSTLPKVDALADSVAHSAQRVGKLAEEIEHKPDSLLWGRNAARPGPGEAGFQ